MMIFFLFMMFMFCFFLLFTLHFLIFLSLVEFMVLLSFLFMGFSGFGLISCIFFLLVGVCVGAYSISLYIETMRFGSSSFFMSNLFF